MDGHEALGVNGIWRPIYDSDELPAFLSTDAPRSNRAEDPQGTLCDEEESLSLHERDVQNDSRESDIDDNDAVRSVDGLHKDDSQVMILTVKKQRTSVSWQNKSASSHASGNGASSSARKKRTAGGAPPVRKRVTGGGEDSDDEMIWEMRNNGYRDSAIRDRLIKEGRIKYDVKTIATRFKRIKKAKLAILEAKLEFDFEDYLEEDDEALQWAMANTEDQYAKELAEIEKRRWEHVAEDMNTQLPAPKFTSNLAQQRWNSLQDGTAIVPLERDPNPEARTARIKEEKADRQRRKEAEELRVRQELDEGDLSRAEAARQAAETKEEKVRARMARKAEKEERSLKHHQKLKAAAEALEKKSELKASLQVQKTIGRQQRVQRSQDERAERAWQRQLDTRDRRQREQQDRLKKAQDEAQRKALELQEAVEEEQRKEMIRRHMRAAGAWIAAPTAV